MGKKRKKPKQGVSPFKHIVILLKDTLQQGAVHSKTEIWMDIDQKIGQWISKNGKRVTSYHPLLKEVMTGRIPIYYGKGGKLSIVPLEHMKEIVRLSLHKKTDWSEMPEGCEDYFSHRLAATQVAEYYQNEIKEKIAFDSTTFRHTAEWEVFQRQYSQVEDLYIEEMLRWKEENKDISHSAFSEMTDKGRKHPYAKHLTICKEKGFQLVNTQKREFVCSRCQSKWNKIKTPLSHAPPEWRLQVPSFKPEINRMTNVIKKKREEEEKLKKEIVFLLTEEIPKIIVKQTQVEMLKKPISEAFVLTKSGVFDKRPLSIVQEEVKTFLETFPRSKEVEAFGLAVYDVKEDFCRMYVLSDIEEQVQKVKEMQKTANTADELMTKVHKAIQSHQLKWAYYQNGRVDVSQEEKIGYFVSEREVMEVLSFIDFQDGKIARSLLIDILKGSKQKKVRESDFQGIVQYGLLAHLKKEDIENILIQMVKKGWVEEKGHTYMKLAITQEGQQRLMQVGVLLTDAGTEEQREKEQFFSQSFKRYMATYDTVRVENEWRFLYLNNRYQQEGILFLKEVLQHYKEETKNYPALEKFIQKVYEKKHDPILKFYQNNTKNRFFLQVIEDLLQKK